MIIFPLHHEIEAYLHARRLDKKFQKQATLFIQNPFHRRGNRLSYYFVEEIVNSVPDKQ